MGVTNVRRPLQFPGRERAVAGLRKKKRTWGSLGNGISGFRESFDHGNEGRDVKDDGLLAEPLGMPFAGTESTGGGAGFLGGEG